MIWRGNISGTETSPDFGGVFIVNPISIVNKSGGAATVTLYVVPTGGGSDIAITPNSLSLAATEVWQTNFEFQIYSGDKLKIVSSASVDYYICLTNIQPI